MLIMYVIPVHIPNKLGHIPIYNKIQIYNIKTKNLYSKIKLKLRFLIENYTYVILEPNLFND